MTNISTKNRAGIPSYKRLMARSREHLFFKILLLACTLNFLSMAIAVVITFTSSSGPEARMVRRAEKRQENLAQLVYLYAVPIIDTWALKGKEASIQYAAQFEHHIDFTPYLFNATGRSLSGRQIPPELGAIVNQFKSSGETSATYSTDTGIFAVRRILGPNGGAYIVAGGQGAPKRFSIFPPDMAVRIAISFIMLALLSFLLTRHITKPIVKLRKATQAFADGRFGVRVSDSLGQRQDEIGKLGADFDQMAADVQTLINDRQQLLTDISHELRSPLARLNIALEIARTKAGEAVMPSLSRIGLETERLNALIGEILLINRLETASNLRSREWIDLSGLVRRIGEDANFEAKRKSVCVVISPCPDILLQGYPEILYRAIENIVRNAIRHTPTGKQVKIGIHRKEAPKETILITIEDEGPGVPEAALSRIFKPFYRVEGDRGRKTGGAGVGLAIADRAVQLHNGNIRAENLKCGGLKMTVTIPIR